MTGLVVQPQKEHGTRGWEGTWNQRPGYPPLAVGGQTENITFPRALHARDLQRLKNFNVKFGKKESEMSPDGCAKSHHKSNINILQRMTNSFARMGF